MSAISIVKILCIVFGSILMFIGVILLIVYGMAVSFINTQMQQQQQPESSPMLIMIEMILMLFGLNSNQNPTLVMITQILDSVLTTGVETSFIGLFLLLLSAGLSDEKYGDSRNKNHPIPFNEMNTQEIYNKCLKQRRTKEICKDYSMLIPELRVDSVDE